jgi:hypothetical protein
LVQQQRCGVERRQQGAPHRDGENSANHSGWAHRVSLAVARIDAAPGLPMSGRSRA